MSLKLFYSNFKLRKQFWTMVKV